MLGDLKGNIHIVFNEQHGGTRLQVLEHGDDLLRLRRRQPRRWFIQ